MSLTADQKRAIERATIEVGIHGNRDILRRVLEMAVLRGSFRTNLPALTRVEYFQLGNVEGLRVLSRSEPGEPVQETARYFRLCADK